MANIMEIYKCEICGNIIEVLHGGAGTLVCCGQPMKLMQENTVDASKEKHVPVYEVKGNTVTVNIGSIPHPMEDKHYIEWIQIITDKKSYRHFLKPGETPTATFEVDGKIKKVREYCNLHLLWATT